MAGAKAKKMCLLFGSLDERGVCKKKKKEVDRAVFDRRYYLWVSEYVTSRSAENRPTLLPFQSGYPVNAVALRAPIDTADL